MSNLRCHVKICWGEKTVAVASSRHDASSAWAVLKKHILKDGSITAAFERVRKEKVAFSNQQHNKAKLQWVLSLEPHLFAYTLPASMKVVGGVAESLCPFKIDDDHRFQCLMQTGCLDIYIPSAWKVSHDVKQAFL